jgi:hypothetical protein
MLLVNLLTASNQLLYGSNSVPAGSLKDTKALDFQELLFLVELLVEHFQKNLQILQMFT